MRRYLVAASMVCAVVVAGSVAVAGPSAQEDLEDWRAKIDVIVTEDEAEEWEELDSEAERRAFVEAFWQRRDPTPGTAANEFRDNYLQRLAFVERRFGRGGVPGYKTDMGKVFLVYGPPKEQVMRPTIATDRGDRELEGGGGAGAGAGAGADPGAGRGGGDARGADDIVWVYEIGTNPYLEDREEIRFSVVGGQRDAYAVRTRLEYHNEAFLASIRVPEASAAAGRAAAAAGRGDVAGTPGAAAAIPPEARLLRQLLEGGPARDDLRLEHTYHYFPAPNGNTFVALLFEVGTEGLAAAGVEAEAGAEVEAGEQAADEIGEAAEEAGEAAEAEEAEEAGEAAEAAEEAAGEAGEAAEAAEEGAAGQVEGSGAAAMDAGSTAEVKVFGALIKPGEAGEEVLHQFSLSFEAEADGAETSTRSFGLPLAPGAYRLVWGVMDAGSERATTRRDDLQVPDYTAGDLRLTSVIVHGGMEERTDAVALDRVYEGLRLGNVQLAADLDREFERDDTLEVLYFVMGAQSDPATQTPRLQVDYRILRVSDGTSVARLPTQELDFVAVGQQIPLAQVSQISPGEDYVVEIRVEDLVGGVAVTEEVPFHLAAAEDSDPGPTSPPEEDEEGEPEHTDIRTGGP